MTSNPPPRWLKLYLLALVVLTIWNELRGM